MNKTQFFNRCPKTRAEFVRLYNSNIVFRNYAQVYGFSVIGGNVMLPNGMVANVKVK